jgi:non-homologous end joining protein Ku
LRVRLEKLIEAKAAGQAVTVASTEEEEAPQVVNLMDALKKSLERAKAQAPPKAAKSKKAKTA